MNMEEINKLSMGDRIEFIACLGREVKQYTRKVTGKNLGGKIGVCVSSFHGWKNYTVLPHEIVRVVK